MEVDMNARDLMVPPNKYLMPGDGLGDFLESIQAARSETCTRCIRTLPVLDAKDRPVGVLSFFDILRGLYPDYLYIADLHSFTWDGMLESMAKKIAQKKVSDLMATPVITVREDHPLMECVDQMIKHRISTIFVVNGEGRLVGILYEDDIFFAIAEAIKGGKQP
jgi:CBS domain-containing protein